MKAFIRDFPQRLKSAPVLAQYRNQSSEIVAKCNSGQSSAGCSD
jgi:hypothetical protein